MASNLFQTPQRLLNNENQSIFKNGKTVQRNETTKKKNALGDIKNFSTPFMMKSKHKNEVNGEQTDLLRNIGVMALNTELNSGKYADYLDDDTVSFNAVDYTEKWAQKEMLTDSEVNEIISRQFCYITEKEYPPPPPSPIDELQALDDTFEFNTLSLEFNADLLFSRNQAKPNNSVISDDSMFDCSVDALGLSVDELDLSI